MQAGALNRGQELRRNYAINPSFETNELNWVNASGGVRTQIDTNPYVGSNCLQVTYAAAGTFKYVGQNTVIEPGKSYIKASVAVRRIAGAAFAKMRVGYRDHPTTGALTYGPLSGGQPITGDWSTLTIEHAIPATTQHLVVIAYAADTADGTSVVAGSSWAIDALTISLGTTAEDTPAPTYLDGSVTGPGVINEWLGAPDASVSVQYLRLSDDVRERVSRVLVNGIRRDVLSWSTDHEIASDLPAQVSGGTGITQATGSIEWGSRDVETGARNPWNASTGWIPQEGDIVRIYVADGATEWQQFVGVIDSTSGSIGQGFTSKLIDRTDDFSAGVSIPALAAVMPPWEASGPFRRFRLSPRWYIMRGARAAGFYATPAPEENTTLDVPAFGSMYPVIGTAKTCHKGTNSSMAPEWPNGTHVADVSSTFLPDAPRTPTRAVQLTMNIAAAHNGVTSLVADYGGKTVNLRATATSVLLQVNGSTVLTVPRTGDCVAVALFENGAARLRTSAGANVSGSAAWTATSPMTEARIVADPNSLVNGFIISHPTQASHEFANLHWTPTANIITGAMHDAMLAQRGTGGMSARDLLDEIATALLFPYWLDENGVFQAVQSDILRGRSSSRGLSTLNDVFALDWERNLLSVRSRIEARYDIAAVTRQRNYSTKVWAGDSVVLQSGEQHEQLIEASGDESWLMVDDGPSAIHSLGAVEEFNKGIGSVYGGIYTNGVDEQWATDPAVNKLTVTFEQINSTTWKVTHTAGTLAAGWQVELRTWSSTFTGNTALWPHAWDQPLPVFAAKGRLSWSEKTRSPAVIGGRGPTYTHECGAWATGHLPATETKVVDEIVDFLSTQLADTHPVITGLEVTYDPRLQLGDVVTIQSADYMGVILRCLIIGVSRQGSTGGYSMGLSVRVISAQSTFTTYEEFETAMGGAVTYDAFATIWGGTATYNDFNNDPLRGTN